MKNSDGVMAYVIFFTFISHGKSLLLDLKFVSPSIFPSLKIMFL